MFQKDMMFPVLLDTYGVLLTERKREILDYHYNEDYSLSEISEITGISRQGVRDSIKKSEEEIYAFEEKLNIAKRNMEQSAVIDKVLENIAKIRETANPDTVSALDEVTQMLNTLRTVDKSDGDVQE